MKADLALTGGVHSATGVVKAMTAGAKVATMASALLERGISFLAVPQPEARQLHEDPPRVVDAASHGRRPRAAAGLKPDWRDRSASRARRRVSPGSPTGCNSAIRSQIARLADAPRQPRLPDRLQPLNKQAMRTRLAPGRAEANQPKPASRS